MSCDIVVTPMAVQLVKWLPRKESRDRDCVTTNHRDKDSVKVIGRVSVFIAQDCLLVRDSVYRALLTDADVTVVGAHGLI